MDKERKAADMSPAELAEWDAEIEADFRRTVAETRRKPKAAKGKAARVRHMGGPVGLWEDAAGRGEHTLVVAMHIYRRTEVCKSKTISLNSAELARLKVDKAARSRALQNLEAAGLIATDKSPGRKTIVTLLWTPA